MTNPVLTQVKAGATLVGVTRGATPHIVYRLTNGNVEAAPVAGGAPEVLATALGANDIAFVNGGAVAWVTGYNAATQVWGATNFWTKANGVKTINSATHGFFAASDDATRVAIEVDATDDISGKIAVTSAAAPSAAAPAFTGPNALNLAAFFADSCAPQFGFVGTTFVTAHCVGTADTAERASFFTMAVGDAAPVERVTTSLFPYWVADSTGTKFAVADSTGATLQAKVLITAGAATTIGDAESGIASLGITNDGAYIVYRTSGGALKRATVAATPVVSTLAASGVMGILATSSDSKKYAYYTADSGFGDYNVITVDASAAAPTPVTLVSTPVAYNVVFTADGARVVYLDGYNDVDGTGTLKTVAAGGGAAINFGTKIFVANVADQGTGMLATTTLTNVSGTRFTSTVQYANAAVAGALKPGASNVMLDSDDASRYSAWSGKTFVFQNDGANAGVSKLALP